MQFPENSELTFEFFDLPVNLWESRRVNHCEGGSGEGERPKKPVFCFTDSLELFVQRNKNW